MWSLIASLAALALGPLLVRWARRARPAVVALDAFVVVVIGGLVLLHVLPHAIADGGWAAVAIAVLGLALPTFVERGIGPTAGGTRRLLIVAAMAGFVVHTMVDGMALGGAGQAHAGHQHAGHEHGVSTPVIWAVLAHRLPVGIGIWWILPRTLGYGVAVLATLLAMAGTVAGYAIADAAVSDATAYGAALFQALLAGSLLHVVLHAHIPTLRDAQRWHFASAFGALLAIGAVWAAGGSHDHGPDGTAAVFFGLVRESAPALLFAYLAIGLAQTFLPQGWASRITRGNRFTQALRGMAIGLPLPVCSCGVVPIYRELVVKGSAVAAAVAFLIATPELEIAAVLLTYNLMGFDVAATRLLTAALLALGVGMLIGKLAPALSAAPASDDAGESGERPPATGPRILEAMRFGFGEAVDNTAPWILLGIGVAALLVPWLDPEMLRSVPAGLDVPLAALLGMPLYVCASGSTPLAAVLVAQGLSPGAAIAFLLTGPATNVTTFGVVQRLHGRSTAVVFSVAMLVGATLLGYGTNLLIGAEAIGTAFHVHDHGATAVQLVAVIALAALFFASLLRQGTRAFIDQLFAAPHDEHSDADHDHCSHDEL